MENGLLEKKVSNPLLSIHVPLSLSLEEEEALQRYALLNGYIRLNERSAWSRQDRREAVIYAVNHMIKNPDPTRKEP